MIRDTSVKSSYFKIFFSFLSSLLFLSGCTTATPHEALNKALKKTFETDGYNYVSTTRITKIVFTEEESNATDPITPTDTFSSIYLKKGLDVIRGFSIGIDGAIDYRGSIRSEVTYDVHYNRDNVEVSVKLPFMFDYSTKTLYLGKTFLNTLFPMKPEDEGKFIRFDLNDSLLSTVIGEESLRQLDDANVRKINQAFKSGTLKAIQEINASQFVYRPLVKGETQYRDFQKVHVSLDKNQSIRMIFTIADAVIQTMYTENLITKEGYGTYMFMSDPKQIALVADKFNLSLDFDFGIDSKGDIVFVLSGINVSDKDEQFALGVENKVYLNNFNAPQFTLDPKSAGSVDYLEVFREWEKLFPPSPDKELFDELEQIPDQSSEQII